MTMPVDNFHEQHDLPPPSGIVLPGSTLAPGSTAGTRTLPGVRLDPGTYNTGWKYPTLLDGNADPVVPNVKTWQEDFTVPEVHDDLQFFDNQVATYASAQKEPWETRTLIGKKFNGNIITEENVTIDSFSIWIRVAAEIKYADTIDAKWSEVSLGFGSAAFYNYPIFPSTSVANTQLIRLFGIGTDNTPSFSNPKGHDDIFAHTIPATAFRAEGFTKEDVNNPELMVGLKFTKTAGSSGSLGNKEFYIRLWTLGLSINYTVKDPLPPGASTEAANLLKMGSF